MSDKNDEREDEFTGPVNLGNPSEFTILEFSEKVVDKTDFTSQIIYCPPHDNPTQRKPDITLANWEAKITLSDYLDKPIKHYKHII